MKMLKYSLFLLAPLGQLSAAVYTFDGLTPDAILTTPGSGISIGLPESNLANAPVAYAATILGNPAGALGGEFRDPLAGSTSVKLTMASSLTSSFATVAFDMLIKDSSNAVPNRDIFGFSIANGSGASIVQLQFLPVAQSSNPSGGDPGQWLVAFSVGGAAPTFTSIALDENSLYFVNMSFSGSSLILKVGNTSSTTTFNTTIAGFNGAVNGFGNVAFNWDKVASNPGFGDNSILFDNVVVAVPEPSALLMSGLASAVLLVRRRRN